MEMTLLCRIDKVQYEQKPSSKKEISEIQTRFKATDFMSYPAKVVIQALERGQTIALAECENLEKERFKQANSVALDFDNGHGKPFDKADPAASAEMIHEIIKSKNTITPDEVNARCREKGFSPPAFIYKSFSYGRYYEKCVQLEADGLISADECERIRQTGTFRAVWVFDTAVTDKTTYFGIYEQLRKIFPQSDDNFKPAGILFGTRYTDTIRSDGALLDITTIPRPEPPPHPEPQPIAPPAPAVSAPARAAAPAVSATTQAESQRRNIEVYLRFVKPSMLNFDEWLMVCNAMYHEGFSYSEFDDWCRSDGDPRYDEAENLKHWNSRKTKRFHGGVIHDLAVKCGMTDEAFRAALYPQGIKPAHNAEFVAYNFDGTPETQPAGAAAPLDQSQQPPPKTAFGLVPFSAITPQSVNWLWFPYIPRGKITLLSADPGTGKTFFALYLAACVSTGKPFWADNRPYRQPEKAIYQTAEDGYADTIIPRIMSMNCNRNNIFLISEETQGLSLKDSIEYIENAMKATRPALMIFDPLQAYLGADVNMNAANEVRPILSRIAKLAETYNTAVILIMHNSKMSSVNKALYRALGSIDIPGAARSMLVMGKDPQDDSRRIVCHEKSSLAKNGDSLAFKIDPDNGGVIFDGFSDLTASDLVSPFTGGTREKPADALNYACGQILELMGDDGYADFTDVKSLAALNGISQSTLNRARNELMIKTVMLGFGKKKASYWVSPDINIDEFKKARQAEHDNQPSNTDQSNPIPETDSPTETGNLL